MTSFTIYGLNCMPKLEHSAMYIITVTFYLLQLIWTSRKLKNWVNTILVISTEDITTIYKNYSDKFTSSTTSFTIYGFNPKIQTLITYTYIVLNDWYYITFYNNTSIVFSTSKMIK